MPNILETINHRYHQPANFDEGNSEFDIFKTIPDDHCRIEEIKFFKNIHISTNSVAFNYFNIIHESCISEENYQKYQKGFKFFLKFIFPQFNLSKERFLLITDEWTSNYYHWQLIALKKLLILKEKNLLENSLLFLPKKYQRYKFVLPSLEKFGIKKNQIVFLRRKSNIKVKELALALCTQNHPLMFRELRKILTQDVKNDSEFGEKIYVSRAEQVLRFVENENEVMELLRKYGFKKIIAEKFSYDEQVEIFSKAKYVVAPHGAGLTNLIFMKENSAVLEMCTAPYSQKPVTDYCKLADMLGIKYFYQLCAAGERSQVKDFHHASLLVDLDKLERNLKLMLGTEIPNS